MSQRISSLRSARHSQLAAEASRYGLRLVTDDLDRVVVERDRSDNLLWTDNVLEAIEAEAEIASFVDALSS